MRNTLPLPEPPPRETKVKQFCDYCGSRFDADLDLCPHCGAGVSKPVPEPRRKPVPCPPSSGGTPSRCAPPPPAPHGGTKIRV